MDTTFDAVIVGARVAGASLALQLGRYGRRVLLVDRDRFPSDTLSTHFLQPPAVAMLAHLGVLADVEAAGLRRLTRQRTYIGDAMLEGPMRAPGAYGLCARRDRLDMSLIRHAVAHPSVTFLEQTRAERLIWQDGRVTGVQLSTSDGRRITVHARAVIGADGKYSKVARWAGSRTYDETPALRPVYYAYYRGVAPLPEPACEVFYHGGHIGFVLPMEPDMDCLALEIQPEEFASFRADPVARFEAAFAALPGMAARLARAERQGAVLGTRGVENFLRVPYGPGWALTGDAAYCKDPSTGTGIEDAFRQSIMLADALNETLDGADWEVTLSRYHRARDAAVGPAFRATLAYTRTGAVPAEALAWLQGVLAVPGLVRLLALGLPALAGSPDLFPAGVLPLLERQARVFGAPTGRHDDGRAAA
jgi:2-polyprenyl-6-methoxyphenol hydroxylase-like FAD-dependent oxidoreductase